MKSVYPGCVVVYANSYSIDKSDAIGIIIGDEDDRSWVMWINPGEHIMVTDHVSAALKAV